MSKLITTTRRVVSWLNARTDRQIYIATAVSLVVLAVLAMIGG